jgi:hypothetical protein
MPSSLPRTRHLYVTALQCGAGGLITRDDWMALLFLRRGLAHRAIGHSKCR